MKIFFFERNEKRSQSNRFLYISILDNSKQDIDRILEIFSEYNYRNKVFTKFLFYKINYSEIGSYKLF